MRVGELTEEHVGWQIRTGRHRGASEYSHGSIFTVRAIRSWTHNGLTTVGLLDPTEARGNIIGTELHYDPDVECELVKPMTAKAKRTARLRAS